MNKRSEDILYEIYHSTSEGGYVSIDELETVTGLSGSVIRAEAETMKEKGFLFEREEGLQVSETGRAFSKSRWV